MSEQAYANSQSRTLTVLGIDPGYASMGLSVLKQEGAGKPVCLHLSVMETEKAKKKVMRNLRVATDDQRRTTELFEEIHAVLSSYVGIYAVAYEVYSPFGGRMGGNAWKVARVEGLLQGIALERGLVVMPFLPADLKNGVAGKLTASKEAIQKALRKKVDQFGEMLDTFPETKKEHAGDAAGHAFLALQEARQMQRIAGVV